MTVNENFHLAFDVYGTLIDPSGVGDVLKEIAGSRAERINAVWRSKQLEYSFRSGLARHYVDFSVCTERALDYACAEAGTVLSKSDRARLLNAYTALPAYGDVAPGLEFVRKESIPCHAFSNGSADAVAALLKHNGIDGYFTSVVSAAELRQFKPAPEVYARFCERAGTAKENAVLISGNAFDVIGAKQYGMKAVWLKRAKSAVFDPWGISPDAVAEGFDGLQEAVEAVRN